MTQTPGNTAPPRDTAQLDPVTAPPPLRALRVVYGDEEHLVQPGREFSIGRESDLSVDDNPYLHRRFLRIRTESGLWWLENVGTVLTATVTDANHLDNGQWMGTLGSLGGIFNNFTGTWSGQR